MKWFLLLLLFQKNVAVQRTDLKETGRDEGEAALHKLDVSD